MGLSFGYGPAVEKQAGVDLASQVSVQGERYSEAAQKMIKR